MRNRLQSLWRYLTRPITAVDRWDVLSIAGAGLLGGGIWGEWGPARACMLWGCLLLSLAGLHAWRSRGVE